MHILLSLFLAAAALAAEPAPAFTKAELQHRKETLAKINRAFGEADAGVLPPCAGLDHTSEVSLRIEPARDCPRAQELYAYLVKMDRGFRDACREMERQTEALFRDPQYCAKREQPHWISEQTKKITELKQRAGDFALDGAPKLDDLEEAIWEGKPGQGEFARMGCALPLVIGMQFRKKQLAMLNKHFGQAEAALYESCSGQQEPGEDFLRYMREGY